MGEIAEMMLDGTMDPETGEFNFDGEDGPGFPMTGAQARAWTRADRLAGRKDREPKLTGLWGRIARAVRDTPMSRDQIADMFRAEGESRKKAKYRVGTAIYKMTSARYLTRQRGRFIITATAAQELMVRDSAKEA